LIDVFLIVGSTATLKPGWQMALVKIKYFHQELNVQFSKRAIEAAGEVGRVH
jgi:hypothetical protein